MVDGRPIHLSDDIVKIETFRGGSRGMDRRDCDARGRCRGRGLAGDCGEVDAHAVFGGFDFADHVQRPGNEFVFD